MNTETELFQQACALQADGKLPQAIQLLEQILQLNPNHQDALHGLGLIFVQQGDMESAIDFLQRALHNNPKNPILHNNLANALRKHKQLQQAKEHYQQAIQLSPNYAQAHANLAGIFAMQNNYTQALIHYKQAIHAQPDFVTAHYNLGLLLLKNNQLKAAQIQFNNVLSLSPDYYEARFYLGVLSLEANQLNEAEHAFQQVLMQNNEHVQALTNLGVIALKRRREQLAVDFFTRALTLDNDHIEARNNLAATFMHHDRFENALMHYDVLLQKIPHNIEYLYNSGVAQMALGHLNEAISHFDTLLSIEAQHFAALNNLAAIYIRLDDKERAKILLRQAIHANPKDLASQHMLRALEGEQQKALTCSEYAQNLFNNYALYYDQHLQQHLHYQLPQHVQQLCQLLGLNDIFNTLELGCGTGLTGAILRPLSKSLTGVDIAAKMIKQAKEKKIYDQLIESEIISFLKNHKKKYQLIIATDVLPYFGELDEFFTATSQHLKSSGYFIFSTEISEHYPWKLQESARFSHHHDYIVQHCESNHLKMLHCNEVVARTQNTQEMPVLLCVAQKT